MDSPQYCYQYSTQMLRFGHQYHSSNSRGLISPYHFIPIMNIFLFITYISWILKLLDQLTEILISNISNGNPCPFVWNFGPDIHRSSQPLTLSSQIITWFWRVEFPLFQTINIQINAQGDLLLLVLNFPVFPNIAHSTTCHVHSFELLLKERLPSGSTMINSWWWCYKYY